MCCVCGPLRHSAELAEGGCYSYGTCGFGGKSSAGAEVGCMCGEVPGRGSAGERVRWGSVSRNLLSGVNGVSQLNGQHRFGTDLSWASCVRGALHKGQTASASTPERDAPILALQYSP